MPIYEWKCPECGQLTEVLILSSEPPESWYVPPECHRCGALMERKVSAPAIRLKGSGWQTPSPKDTDSPKNVLS